MANWQPFLVWLQIKTIMREEELQLCLHIKNNIISHSSQGDITDLAIFIMETCPNSSILDFVAIMIEQTASSPKIEQLSFCKRLSYLPSEALNMNTWEKEGENIYVYHTSSENAGFWLVDNQGTFDLSPPSQTMLPNQVKMAGHKELKQMCICI